jgi:hypothetical protein
MSEKSLRGTGPGPDQARDPAAPGQGRSADSGGAPVEPRTGERTDRAVGREASGPRVSLVPVVPPSDGRVETESSTADTTKRVDSGRTTLMGVRSPLADGDKPTANGREVHLPAEKGRLADSRSAASSGVIPTVELDPSSTRRIGKVEPPGRAPVESPTPAPAATSARKDNDEGARVADERTMAAAAATFRGATPGSEPPASDPGAGRESVRGSWVADRTQEFHLDPPPPNRAFTKALITGVVVAVGLGVMVQSFIRAQVRSTAESAELLRTPTSLPIRPAPPSLEIPPPTAPVNVTPAPTAVTPEPETPPAAPPSETPPPEIAHDTAPAAEDPAREDHRAATRAKTALAGRPAPPARSPRASSPVARPGLPSVPGPTAAAVPPALPTSPPPLSAAPADKPPVRAEPPRTEPAAKPYDPDMPMPPSAE